MGVIGRQGRRSRYGEWNNAKSRRAAGLAATRHVGTSCRQRRRGRFESWSWAPPASSRCVSGARRRVSGAARLLSRIGPVGRTVPRNRCAPARSTSPTADARTMAWPHVDLVPMATPVAATLHQNAGESVGSSGRAIRWSWRYAPRVRRRSRADALRPDGGKSRAALADAYRSDLPTCAPRAPNGYRDEQRLRLGKAHGSSLGINQWMRKRRGHRSTAPRANTCLRPTVRHPPPIVAGQEGVGQPTGRCALPSRLNFRKTTTARAIHTRRELAVTPRVAFTPAR